MITGVIHSLIKSHLSINEIVSFDKLFRWLVYIENLALIHID